MEEAAKHASSLVLSLQLKFQNAPRETLYPFTPPAIPGFQPRRPWARIQEPDARTPPLLAPGLRIALQSAPRGLPARRAFPDSSASAVGRAKPWRPARPA